MACADALMCLTPAVESAARDCFRTAAPAVLLPSGTASPPPADAVRDLDVVYAGKLESRKGVDDLVGALARLPGVTAHVAGGDAAQARALDASAHRAGASLRALGWQEPARVAELLDRAKVALCPLPVGVDSVSDRFTSPMKLLQAMAHGTAVVASDVAPVRAIATDGQDALLVAPGDCAGLAAAIARLLDDPALRARLGRAARARARTGSRLGRARGDARGLRASAAPRRGGHRVIRPYGAAGPDGAHRRDDPLPGAARCVGGAGAGALRAGGRGRERPPQRMTQGARRGGETRRSDRGREPERGDGVRPVGQQGRDQRRGAGGRGAEQRRRGERARELGPVDAHRRA